ncbi:hypothetical protein SNE40_008019 [Patella caerulea]|uniref:Homeobox domain-containing protein n=2 Tax=Patellogastropoda TaxID=69675 RepID=A0AAN8PVZ2_PATCE
MSTTAFTAYSLASSTPTSLPTAPMTSAPSATPGGRACCENGRPILTDPHTGQTICSCQYGAALLNYPRVPGLAESVYSASAAYAAAASQGYVSLGAEGSAFYSPLAGGPYELKDSPEAWRALTQPGFPYDPTMIYPYGAGYGGLDLNSRRKNATRENTTTLKAWLYEHRKNPYPTKGEKIMLAIITKMTLTQVSTWFANARRRLKKENKMTWSPRNRSEDGSDGLDNGDVDSDGGKEEGKDGRSTPGLGDLGSGRSTPTGGDDLDMLDSKDAFINVDDEDSDDRSLHDDRLDPDDEVLRRMKAGIEKAESDKVCDSTESVSESGSKNKSESSDSSVRNEGHATGTSSSSQSNRDTEQSSRPKIWSISEFLHKTSSSSSSSSSRPAAISTHARPPHTSGLFYLPGNPSAWSSGRYHGVHPYPMSLSHSTISYPYSITSHAAGKSPLTSPANIRALDSFKDGEKLMRPNVLFSPARDLDGLRPSAVPANRLVESNI